MTILKTTMLLLLLFPLGLKGPEAPPMEFPLELTKENVWMVIRWYPFHDHKLVMKSAIAECGHQFHTYNAQQRNNIFGMHCSSRADTCDGLYTVYSNWWESIRDRWIHEQKHYKGDNYRYYLDRHWGLCDGTYTIFLDQIKI
jgi:hypothetical protein